MQVASGENWGQLMFELATSENYGTEQCVDNQTYDEMQEDGVKG